MSLEAAGTVEIGGDLTVCRLGYGAMRLTGDGIWGPPKNRDEALAVLRRAIECDDPALRIEHRDRMIADAFDNQTQPLLLLPQQFHTESWLGMHIPGLGVLLTLLTVFVTVPPTGAVICTDAGVSCGTGLKVRLCGPS